MYEVKIKHSSRRKRSKGGCRVPAACEWGRKEVRILVSESHRSEFKFCLCSSPAAQHLASFLILNKPRFPHLEKRDTTGQIRARPSAGCGVTCLSGSTADFFRVHIGLIDIISCDAQQSIWGEILNPRLVEGKPTVLRLWSSVRHPVGGEAYGKLEGRSQQQPKGLAFSVLRWLWVFLPLSSEYRMGLLVSLDVGVGAFFPSSVVCSVLLLGIRGWGWCIQRDGV